MNKLMILVAVPLFALACNGTQSVNTEDLADKAKEFAGEVKDKSVELYDKAAPVVEKAAKVR